MENSAHSQQILIGLLGLAVLVAAFAYRGLSKTKGNIQAFQVLLITGVWALALMAVEVYLNPQEYNGSSEAVAPTAGRPQLTVSFNHLCCSGCAVDTTKAMTAIPWLTNVNQAKQLPSLSAARSATPGQTATLKTYAGSLIADIQDQELKQIDFMDLDQKLRKTGLSPSSVIITGVPHFQLVAKLPHMCCPLCVGALQEILGSPQGKAMVGLQQKPVVEEVDANNQLVVLDFNGQADGEQLIKLLDQAGFVPETVVVKKMM